MKETLLIIALVVCLVVLAITLISVAAGRGEQKEEEVDPHPPGFIEWTPLPIR